MTSPVPVLISAKDRPLYLWAALDSLYRHTRYPHRFILLDMASTDPGVRQVVAGFERRGMFDEVIWAERNDPEILWNVAWRLGASGAPYIGYVESDVIIEPAVPCWLERLAGLMEQNPRLAMLGAAIDQEDFVELQTARCLEPKMPEPQLRALIKADSPERKQDVASAQGAAIFHPHNPAGRLLLVRNSALREVGQGTDGQLHNRFCALGYETGVATNIRHRHLSLLHIFDYPDYDVDARNRFMNEVDSAAKPSRTALSNGLSDQNDRVKPSSLPAWVAGFRSCLVSALLRQRRLAAEACTRISSRSKLRRSGAAAKSRPQ